MKKFLYLFFLLPFGQIFGAEGGQENDQLNENLLKAFSSAISANQSALSRFITRAGDCRFTAQMPPPPPPFLLPPPPPLPFLLPPPPLAGQAAQSFTPGQHQLTTGANSFSFQMPPKLPTFLLPPPELPPSLLPLPPQLPTQAQNQPTIILTDMPVQPQLPPAAAPITAFSSPAAPAVSIPPLPTTVAPIRAIADQTNQNQADRVPGFTKTSDGKYQCTHFGCDAIISTKWADSLTRHKKTHIMHYKCSNCGYKSGSNYNLSRHIKNVCPSAKVEKVTSSSAIGDDVENEAPFLPPFSPPSSLIGPLSDQHQEQGPNLDGAFIAALPSEQPQPFFGQQPFTVGVSEQDIISERLRRIKNFIDSYNYRSLRDNEKEKALAYFTALINSSMVPSTQTIGSATSNASPVDLPTAATVATLAQKKSFQCDLCEKYFAHELNLKKHRTSEHNVN